MGFHVSKYFIGSPLLYGYIIICLTNVLFLGLSLLSHTALCPRDSLFILFTEYLMYKKLICMPIFPGMKAEQ